MLCVCCFLFVLFGFSLLFVFFRSAFKSELRFLAALGHCDTAVVSHDNPCAPEALRKNESLWRYVLCSSIYITLHHTKSHQIKINSSITTH